MSRAEQRLPVCIVRHNYYPDSHVRRDAEALVAAGYDVSVIALRRPNQPARDQLNGVSIYRLPVTHQRGSVLRYAWEYLSFAILAFLMVSWLHLRKRFRVVEVDNMPDILVFSALLPRLTGARVILYIFDNMPELLQYIRQWGPGHPLVRLLAFLEWLSASFAHRVVVTQEMPRRMIAERGVPPEKITVVLNCADEKVFHGELRSNQTRQDGFFEIVTHGVILERYGIHVLIEALPKIAAAVPNVRVQIFGEGEYRSQLETLARQRGMDDKVLFRGFAPLDELLSTLAGADVGYVGMLNNLVLPNKLMEYVALGVPIVLARWPTFEYYFPEETVTFFGAGSSDELAAAVLAIHRDPAAAAAKAERAAQLYNQHYRWSLQREVYLGVYRQQLAIASGQPSDSPSTSLS